MKKRKVYLDYAATTQLDSRVLKEMLPFLKDHFGNPSSLHEYGHEARTAIENSRKILAEAIGAKPQEIVFTSGATEANNLAIKGVLEPYYTRGAPLATQRMSLVTTAVEHHSVKDTADHLERQGLEILRIRSDHYGRIDPKIVYDAIKENTTLVSIMYANNEVGTRQPIEKIGQMLGVLRKKRVGSDLPLYFHTDAVQAFSYLPCKVDALGVDLMSLSAHKFYGPKGIGALYIRKGTKVVPLLDGGGQEFGLRAGTENVAGIVGMGKAVELLMVERDKNYQQVEKLRNVLIRAVLAEVKGVKLTGDPKERLPHIASFVIDGVEGEAVLLMLNQAGIAVSTGSACSSASLEPSHVLLAMGITEEQAHGSLRVSLGKYTTESDIQYFLEVFPKVVNKLRSITPLVKAQG